MHSIEPTLESDLSYCLHHPPCPVKHPATTALIAEYIKRVELLLSRSRMGRDGMKDLAQNHPYLTEEIKEIEQWIKQRKPNASVHGLSEEDQDTLGDWLIKHVSPSYSRARRFVAGVSKSLSKKGAPSKRIHTLKILDARIANGWSYSVVAAKMCDCDKKKHDAHCADSIRKRLKELEEFLTRYGINLKSMDPGEK